MDFEIREFRESDIPEIVRLFKVSDPAWPGGFFFGQTVPEDALRRMSQDERINSTYLAWADGKVVGFINLLEVPQEEKSGYIGLLNSDPSYHGRGVGRELLKRAIQRCVELGYETVTLHTWPGNTRAVPLYKKTGFFWGPEPSGFGELRNFLPLLLSHPLTKWYFDQIDWYDHMKRDLQLGVDEERHSNGTLIYTYRWESPLGNLTAIFDQKTNKLVTLDTPKLYLSLEIPRSNMTTGESQKAMLVAENRTQDLLQVVVVASGKGSVEAQGLHPLILAPAEKKNVPIELKASEGKGGNSSLRLEVAIGEHKVELEGYIKVKPKIDIHLSNVLLEPQRIKRALLSVGNLSPERANLQISIDATAGLKAQLQVDSIALDAGEWAHIPIDLQADRNGSHKLIVKCRTQDGDHREENFELVAVTPGNIYYHERDNTLRIYTDRLELSLNLQGYELSVADRRTGSKIIDVSISPGPPYWPEASIEHKSERDVSFEGQSIIARSTIVLRSKPKAVIERLYRFYADGRLKISYKVLNNDEKQQVGLMTSISPQTGNTLRHLYFETPEGVRSVRLKEVYLPEWQPHYQMNPDCRWAAIETGEWTIGLLWDENYEARCPEWYDFSLKWPEHQLKAGQAMNTGEIDLILNTGGWQDIRKEWLYRNNKNIESTDEEPYVGPRISPKPIRVYNQEGRAELTFRSFNPREVQAKISLKGNDGFEALPAEATLQGVSSIKAASASITVTSTKPRGAGEIEALVESPVYTGKVKAPTIVLGNTGEVRITQTQEKAEEVWVIDNNWITFSVWPRILGAIYSLEANGKQWLYHNFPEPKPRKWAYPVYGGVYPVLWEQGGYHPSQLGRLAGLKFVVDEYHTHLDSQIPLHGIKLTTTVEHDSLLGLRFEVSYLTTHDSNILFVNTVLRNTGPERNISYSLQVNPAIEPDFPALLRLYKEPVVIPGLQDMPDMSDTRAMGVQYSDGKVLGLVTGNEGVITGYSGGNEESKLTADHKLKLSGGQEISLWHYLVLAESSHDMLLYTSLSDIK